MSYIKAKHFPADVKKIHDKLEKANRKLIYTGGEIRFQSEKDLEGYIVEHFTEIFPDLVLVKRQLSIKMQRCDLLCCTKSVKQPVIIELKNEEDRDLVSQLTRYRKAIVKEKPFAEHIDYSLPVRLVAIAPTFHEDNYTDKEASKFEDDFCFWQFSLENHNNSGQFKLCGKTYDIPYPIFGLPELPSSLDLYSSLPPFTGNFFGKLPEEYRTDFLTLRSLFTSQPKVKEMVGLSYRKVIYGTGEGQNHKKLAEITNTSKGLCLFLWLPTRVKTRIKIPVTRFGFVLANGNSPFSKSSLVEWVVCTKDTIDMKNKPNTNISLSFNRHGMIKWCPPNLYLAQATSGSSNTFWLLMELLKNITLPIDNATLTWWESFKTQTPADLGWYIDLAIKTWNYRVNSRS